MAEETGTAQAEMPKYCCHKEVHALKIKTITLLDSGRGDIQPEDTRYGRILVSAEYMTKHKPQIGGYYVVYADGYKSWSPAEVFEAGYSLIGD